MSRKRKGKALSKSKSKKFKFPVSVLVDPQDDRSPLEQLCCNGQDFHFTLLGEQWCKMEMLHDNYCRYAKMVKELEMCGCHNPVYEGVDKYE